MAWKSPRGGLTRFVLSPGNHRGSHLHRRSSVLRVLVPPVRPDLSSRSSKLNLAKRSTKLNLVLLNLAKFIDTTRTWMLLRALESRFRALESRCSTAVRLLVPYLRLRLCTRLCTRLCSYSRAHSCARGKLCMKLQPYSIYEYGCARIQLRWSRC